MAESAESALERLLSGGATTRRALLGRAGGAALGAGALGALLGACGGDEGAATSRAAAPAVRHPPVPVRELSFANWPLYVDKAVIRSFERANAGADVSYAEEINDNESFFGELRPALQARRPTGRDLVVLTDWMAARWIRLGFVEPIDRRNVPNARNLQPRLRDVAFDRGRRSTLPWQSGITGIIYDRRRTGREIRSVQDLFDPAFKGHVSLLSEPRDTASLVLLGQGIEPERASIDQVLGAIERIEQANTAGQVRAFTGADYTTGLARGDVWIGLGYSGGALQLRADNPNLRFVVPEEGGVLWSDNMLMPARVAHPYAAERMMDFVYDPEVAARISAFVAFVSPVAGAREAMERLNPELAEEELVFPSDETLRTLRLAPDLDVPDAQRMVEAMAAVTGV